MYPRTSAQPYKIFVGATFFRLPCLVVKKGNWGPGQSPDYGTMDLLRFFSIKLTRRIGTRGYTHTHPDFAFFSFCVVLQSGIFTRMLQLRAAHKRRQPALRQASLPAGSLVGLFCGRLEDPSSGCAEDYILIYPRPSRERARVRGLALILFIVSPEREELTDPIGQIRDMLPLCKISGDKKSLKLRQNILEVHGRSSRVLDNSLFPRIIMDRRISVKKFNVISRSFLLDLAGPSCYFHDKTEFRILNSSA